MQGGVDSRMAPQVGLEPTTLRLTAGCSAIELLRSVFWGAPGGRGPFLLLASIISLVRVWRCVFGHRGCGFLPVVGGCGFCGDAGVCSGRIGLHTRRS